MTEPGRSNREQRIAEELAARQARTTRREFVWGQGTKEFWALFVAFYVVCFIVMLYDVVLRNNYGDAFAMAWLWGPVLGVGTPLILYFTWRYGIRVGPWVKALGFAGFLVFLMDVGGLTVRRFMLWFVWSPPIVLFVLYWILTKPTREIERKASAQRKPLAARIHSAERKDSSK